MSVEDKMRGSYKDDRTSNHVDVFSIEKGRKKRIKVSSIFVTGMTGNLVEHNWTISNSLLNTRLILEVNVPKSVKKPKTKICL